MKFYKFLSLFFIDFTFLTFTSCRNNDDEDSSSETKGKLQLKFENGFNNLGNIVSIKPYRLLRADKNISFQP